MKRHRKQEEEIDLLWWMVVGTVCLLAAKILFDHFVTFQAIP